MKISLKTLSHTHTADLAVDWIEDKLYWTSSADEKIRVLNIASIDTLYGETEYNFIEVELENAKFTYIILDPINRCVLYTATCTIDHNHRIEQCPVICLLQH